MATPLLAVLFRNCKHDNNDTSWDNDKIRYALQCDNFAVQIARTPIQMPIPGNSPELMDFGRFRPSLSISGIVNTKGGAEAPGQKGFEFMESFSYTRKHNNQTAYTNTYYFPTKNRLEEDSYRWKTSAGNELELEIADAAVPQMVTHTDDSNQPSTDLNGNHDITTEETFTVDNTTIGGVDILVGDYLAIEGTNYDWEIVKVTAISPSTSFEADRAQLGSTAIVHADGRNVYLYQRAGVFDYKPTGGGVYKVAIQQARFQVDASKEDRWQFQMQFVCKARDDIGI